MESETLLRVAQQQEHDAWVDIWETLKKLTGKTREELNNEEWRKLAEVIEKWAYFDRVRREELSLSPDAETKKWANDFGVFWTP